MITKLYPSKDNKFLLEEEFCVREWPDKNKYIRMPLDSFKFIYFFTGGLV